LQGITFHQSITETLSSDPFLLGLEAAEVSLDSERRPGTEERGWWWRGDCGGRERGGDRAGRVQAVTD
jgi:hypothetical protein